MRAISRRHVSLAWLGLVLLLSGVAGRAQDQRKPFKSGVALVTTDVVVRDKSGQFISDLKIGDFEVLEDGIRQTLVSFSMTHGGRTFNITSAPSARRRSRAS